MDFNTEFFITLTIILSISSMFHGTIGFGFPMISTPLLAMVTDIKTAIVYVAIPTLLINIISIISEGNFFEAIKKLNYIYNYYIIIKNILQMFILIYQYITDQDTRHARILLRKT